MRTSRFLPILPALAAIFVVSGEIRSQNRPRPYRLASIDLKQRIIWAAEVRQPQGRGLAFGGQDQDAADGRAHTRILVDGQWKSIHEELRAKNPLQELHARTWKLRNECKNTLARARSIYFQGLPAEKEVNAIDMHIAPRLARLKQEIKSLGCELPRDDEDQYVDGQLRLAREHLHLTSANVPTIGKTLEVESLKHIYYVQLDLERIAEMFDAEPPPRALDCGRPHRDSSSTSPPAQAIVYDAKTKLYVLFGGDHLDYLTNDTWVFDAAGPRWTQRHPAGAPPPRANHRLEASGDGLVRLTGGYTYTSSTDYVGGQYIDLDDGAWVYDIEKDEWKADEGNDAVLFSADTRTYRTGALHPYFFMQGEKPDAAKFEAFLAKLPANQWVATNPPFRPQLNRDWGVARIDTDRDMLLRWSGGHSAHGGTDVPHFHFSTNRWELPFPVEFPLGQLYSNTEYPDGYNFNLRPWMTGHTYQNYDYDPPSKTMIKAGRPRHFYIYDPDVGDWVGRGEKPQAMQYDSCFYTLTLTATPYGVVCWDKNGRVHRYDHKKQQWVELELSGDKLPGAYVDNSSIVYDGRRDRVLMINTLGYGKPFDGQVWALDLKTSKVAALAPEGMEHADRFATIDKSCYDAANDLLLLGTYLKDSGEHTPTPAYDGAGNRWVLLDLKYETGKRGNSTTRAFPHARSDGVMFDPQRKLFWGTDTNSQVWVLRLDAASANIKALK